MRALACLIALALAATPGAALDFTRLCFAGASNISRDALYLDNHYQGLLPMCDGSRMFENLLDGCDLWRWEGLDGTGYEYCHDTFAVEMDAYPKEEWVILWQIVFKPGRERTTAQVFAFLEDFRVTYGLEDALFVLTGLQGFHGTCGMLEESGAIEEARVVAFEIARDHDLYILGPRLTDLYPENTNNDGCHQNQKAREEDALRIYESLAANGVL